MLTDDDLVGSDTLDDLPQDDGPGDDHVDPAGVDDGDRGPLGVRGGEQPVGHLGDLRGGDPGVVDLLGVVLREPEGDRGDRGDRAA